MNSRIVVTADGSRTLTADETGTEIYHSRHGALHESLYVFVQQGLDLFSAPLTNGLGRPVRLLEVGFGTGLNALLALQWAQKNQHDVSYVGIERHRLPADLLAELDYPKLLSLPEDHFIGLHVNSRLSVPNFDARIETIDVQAYDKDHHVYDLIWFDAFSPRFQPDMWTEPIFKKVYELLAPGGKMVTYSAKGEVQRMLKSLGFDLEKLPGPPGKREMLRATRPA